MTALLIVDMQNDFMPDGALGIPRANEVIPVINQLIDHFDIVLATKDWHPKNHVSFASSHGKKVGDKIKVHDKIQMLWPDHCIQNTKGADLAFELNSKKINKIFTKGIEEKVDSYSAFFDNNQNKATNLEDYLKENNIKKLYIVGVATDYCVKFSALDSHELGYDVYIIEDGCMAIEKKKEKQNLFGLKKKGIQIISSKDLFIY
jgi:nicotinamidase/pyrazinamidase